MDTVSLLAQIEQLKEENYALKYELETYKIHDLEQVKKALKNLGSGIPTDEILIKDWPRYINFIVRQVAKLDNLNVR
jgi:hypothetical protein